MHLRVSILVAIIHCTAVAKAPLHLVACLAAVRPLRSEAASSRYGLKLFPALCVRLVTFIEDEYQAVEETGNMGFWILLS